MSKTRDSKNIIVEIKATTRSSLNHVHQVHQFYTNTLRIDLVDDFLETWQYYSSREETPRSCKRNNIIHSFKSQSIQEMYGKWRKGLCEWCEEDFGENGHSKHVVRK